MVKQAAAHDPQRESVLWIGLIFWLIISGIGFTWGFEWNAYLDIMASDTSRLNALEKATMFWLVTAKSIIPLLPFLAVAALLLHRGYRSAAALIVLPWLAVVYWTTVDVQVMRFTGSHILDNRSYIEVFLRAPDHWQWIGEGLFVRAMIVMVTIAAAALLSIFAICWCAAKIVDRFPRLCTRRSLSVLTGFFLVIVVGAFLTPAFLVGEVKLARLCAALPLCGNLIQTTAATTRDLVGWVRALGGEAPRVRYIAIRSPGTNVTKIFAVQQNPVEPTFPKNVVVLQNYSETDVDLRGWRLQDDVGSRVELKESLRSWQGLRISLPHEVNAERGLALIDPSGGFRYRLSWSPNRLSPKLVLTRDELNRSDRPEINFDEEEKYLDTGIFQDAADPRPLDSGALVSATRLPNVVLIVLESFRHSALSAEQMPNVHSLSQQGLRLCRHYSGSNCSHLGLFSLFYGRSGVSYNTTLKRSIPPQLCQSLRLSGYRSSFVTCNELQGFWGMDDFINRRAFDQIVFAGKCVEEFDSQPRILNKDWRTGFRDWPETDRLKLAEARKILTEDGGRPQFVFVFLLSTHHPYAFPSEFALHKPCGPDLFDYWGKLSSPDQIYNRYKNSAYFLDHELMAFIDSLNLDRNIVIITGDHGESMHEDGTWTHASRLSEIQTRVPFVMLGGGTRPRKIFTATGHADALPTLLHQIEGRPVSIAYCQGRDLLGECAPDDQVFVTPLAGQHSNELVLIRGQRRIVFKANIRENRVISTGVAGLLDDSGRDLLNFSSLR